MDWSDAINAIQDILVLGALLGAIWSAWEFVRNYRRRTEEARVELLAKWRRVSVHKILHSSPNFLPVDDILEKLKSSSFDEEFHINKMELTERELRAVLLEGIETGYFQQLWGDTYGIAQKDFVVDKAIAELDVRDILRKAYNLICFAKGPLESAEILGRIGRKEMEESDFEIAMHELTTRNLVERQTDGRWAKKDN